MIQKLGHYESDYIKKTEETFGQDSYINRFLVGYMRNRAESKYIQKSTELNPGDNNFSSRNLRAYVSRVMSDQQAYLTFHKRFPHETNNSVIQRLREDLRGQLGIIKWMFFNKEYNEIKQLLAKNDDQFIQTVMKKERSLFIKSIVICTTGPIELANSFFGTYMMSGRDINTHARPVTFSHYNLHKGFLSNNVVPLHQNVWEMLKYLGADVGVLNDSSWLEEGMSLQQQRLEKLLQQKEGLSQQLPTLLAESRKDIQTHIETLKQESKGFFAFWGRTARNAKLEALNSILVCFDKEDGSLDRVQLRTAMESIQANRSKVFAGLFTSRTQKIVETLQTVYRDATVLGLSQGKKLGTVHVEPGSNAAQMPESKTGPAKGGKHSTFSKPSSEVAVPLSKVDGVISKTKGTLFPEQTTKTIGDTPSAAPAV
jgi:glucosyltransferase Lgt1/2/3